MFERDEARKELDEAIKQRKAEKIKKALDNCLQHGVDESTILQGEKFLELVIEEDNLINKIGRFLKEENIERLIQIIDQFRYFDSHKMIHLVCDT